MAAALTLRAAIVATTGRHDEALASLDEATLLDTRAPDAGLTMPTLVARSRVEALAGATDAATATAVAALRLAAHSSDVPDAVVRGTGPHGADAPTRHASSVTGGCSALRVTTTSRPAPRGNRWSNARDQKVWTYERE